MYRLFELGVEQTHNCDENAVCVSHSAGYECICADGFIGNGHLCHELVPIGAGPGGTKGESLDIYTKVGDGNCFMRGFNWENLQRILNAMKWSGPERNKSVTFVTTIFQQLEKFGDANQSDRFTHFIFGIFDTNYSKNHSCKLAYSN